jgi:hypothetical protein
MADQTNWLSSISRNKSVTAIYGTATPSKISEKAEYSPITGGPTDGGASGTASGHSADSASGSTNGLNSGTASGHTTTGTLTASISGGNKNFSDVSSTTSMGANSALDATSESSSSSEPRRTIKFTKGDHPSSDSAPTKLPLEFSSAFFKHGAKRNLATVAGPNMSPPFLIDYTTNDTFYVSWEYPHTNNVLVTIDKFEISYD